MDTRTLILVLGAFLTSAAVAFAATPSVKKLAERFGAVDVPKDERRMHKKTMPLLGGLAIFLGFIAAVAIFIDFDTRLWAGIAGAVIILVLGVLDDKYALKALPKLLVQIVAAAIPVFAGVRIHFLSGGAINAGNWYLFFGFLSIPVTIIWIVGLTNAVNFIDGLDGLACGVSTIGCLTLLILSLLLGQPQVALLTAALSGACLGFLPFNVNPAKIFMGDTGATFLGYILAFISTYGLFKVSTFISFVVPFIVMGLPIIDTCWAIIRRLAAGRSPMSSDRGHLHHRLVDMGFSQRQSVRMIYIMSALCGLCAVVLTIFGLIAASVAAAVSIVAIIFGFRAAVARLKKQSEDKL